LKDGEKIGYRRTDGRTDGRTGLMNSIEQFFFKNML
jgi:hypothetical protein